jgi:enoyl-CoA hydratase/carnithine racemase
VRAVVLCGDGPSFCSGLDVSVLGTDEGITPDELARRDDRNLGNIPQRSALAWAALPMPVIAALHGNCFGGGMQIALGPDIRIATPDAKLSVLEVKWGLVPDMGITQTLLPLVRPDVARELTFTGRLVSGEEALALGLVTRLSDDPRAAAQELAIEIAGRSPDAVRAAKALYREAPGRSIADDLWLETELQIGLIGSPNQIAAAVAGMKKEPPEFSDPG